MKLSNQISTTAFRPTLPSISRVAQCLKIPKSKSVASSPCKDERTSVDDDSLVSSGAEKLSTLGAVEKMFSCSSLEKIRWLLSDQKIADWVNRLLYSKCS